MTDAVVGKLIYLITGDSSQLDRALGKSSKSVQKFGGAVKSTQAMVAKFLGGAALVTLGKKLTDLSSDTAELGNKYNVVFRGITKETDIWIDNYTDAVNRGDYATREYLSSLQDIRTGFGDAAPTAAKFSEVVVGVTNDLSSFSNVNFEETSAAIESGLSGQFEALRRLGVGLNVAIINQGEYAKSLGKTWEKMDNLERQEAILSGIVSQSTNAIGQSITDWQDYNYLLGDAAKTSDSFANKTKAMGQDLQDIGSEFGDVIIPAADEMLDVGLDLLDWLDDMSPGVKGLTVAVLGLGAAFAAGGPIAAAVLVLGGLALKARDARDRTDELEEVTGDLVAISTEYKEVTEQLNTNMENLSESEKGVLEARQKLLGLELEKKLAEYSKEYEKYNRQVERESEATGDLEARKRALLLIQNDVEAAQKRYEELEKKSFNGSLTSEESAEWDAYYRNIDKNQRKLAKEIEATNLELTEQKAEFTQVGLAGDESLIAIAKGYLDGIVNIDLYRTTNKALYDEIIRVADGLQAAAEAAGENKDATEDSEEAAESARMSWRKYLQEILNAGDDETGAEAARGFIGAFDREIEADQTIYQALNGTLENWDPVPGLEQKASSIRSAIAELLSIDPDEIDEAFTTEDATIQILLDSLREAEAALADLNIVTVENNEATKKSSGVADEYREKLAALNRTKKEQIMAERAHALVQANANGATLEDLEAIRAYYREILELMEEEPESWSWEDWANEGLSAISDLAGAFAGLNEAIADAKIEALERDVQAQLAAMGLLEQEEENRYTEERQQAQKELADLQADAKKAADIEKRNELEKAAAEKAVELDKLIQQEANEEKKLAIEKDFENKKAQIQYEAAMFTWQMQYVQAIASGAQAVLNALSTQPIWAGLAMAGIAGALTGVEIATIQASQPMPPPSFAVGAWEIPEDMNANIHAGEAILPRPFAEEFRANGGSLTGGNMIVEIYTTEQVETEESQEGDITKLKVFIGETVKQQFLRGFFDGTLLSRFGLKKRGL